MKMKAQVQHKNEAKYCGDLQYMSNSYKQIQKQTIRKNGMTIILLEGVYTATVKCIDKCSRQSYKLSANTSHVSII